MDDNKQTVVNCSAGRVETRPDNRAPKILITQCFHTVELCVPGLMNRSVWIIEGPGYRCRSLSLSLCDLFVLFQSQYLILAA